MLVIATVYFLRPAFVWRGRRRRWRPLLSSIRINDKAHVLIGVLLFFPICPRSVPNPALPMSTKEIGFVHGLVDRVDC